MKKLVLKDKKLRENYKKKEIVYVIYKALLKNKYIDKSIQFVVKEKLKKLNISIVRINNRCFYTGHKRGIIGKVKYVRAIMSRNYVNGYIEGMRKLIW